MRDSPSAKRLSCVPRNRRLSQDPDLPTPPTRRPRLARALAARESPDWLHSASFRVDPCDFLPTFPTFLDANYTRSATPNRVSGTIIPEPFRPLDFLF